MFDLNCILRLRIPPEEAHYGGDLVSGAKLMELFGDAMTLLAISNCSDEGLLKSWENVEFEEQVFPGDYIRIAAKKVSTSVLQEEYELFAYREVESRDSDTADCVLLEPPQLVAQAQGTFVLPYKKVKDSNGVEQ